MFCPSCGAKNPPNAKFCNECGINLEEALKDLKEDDASNNTDENLLEPSESQESEESPETSEYADPDHSQVKKPAVPTDPSELSEPMDDGDDSGTKCVVCKTGNMIPTIHKGTFGFGTRKMIECDSCGAAFEERGQKYKFSSIYDTNNPLWIKYGHQTLTEGEWIRIGEGGVSDHEQEIIKQEQIARETQEVEKQKEKDVNDFLTNLANGKVNINSNGPSPVILKKNENLSIIMENISLQEPRAVRQTRAAYGGPTIRVAKGVSFRLGGASARSESHDEITVIDQGKLVLTNKRLIFIGGKRTVNIDLRKIMAVQAYRDGIESQRENKQKPEYFTGTDKHSITINTNGRINTIPVYGTVLKAAIQGAISQI
jgi:hypothetical protein